MNPTILSIRRDSAELFPVLMQGRVFRYGEYRKAVPREVVKGTDGIESVIFEISSFNHLSQTHLIQKWMKAIRIETFISIGIPWVAVISYGFYQNWKCNLLSSFSSLLGSFFLQISVNLLNDVEDHIRLIDIPGSLSGSGVIQKGWFSAKQLKNTGYGVLGVGIICSIPAITYSSFELLLIGVLGVFAVMSYSSWPFGLKYRFFGNFSVGIFSILAFLGPFLLMGFSIACFSKWDFGIILLGLFFGLTSLGIYFSKYLQNTGWLRFLKAKYLFLLIYVLSFFTILSGIVSHYFPVLLVPLMFMSIPYVVRFSQRVYRSSGPASALLVSIRSDALFCQMIFGLILSICLLIMNFFEK